MLGSGQTIITAEKIRKRKPGRETGESEIKNGKGEAIPAGRDGFMQAKAAGKRCSIFRGTGETSLWRDCDFQKMGAAS